MESLKTGNCPYYCFYVALAIEPMKRVQAFICWQAVLGASSLREAEPHAYMGLCAQPCVGLNVSVLMLINEQMLQTV